MRSWSDNEGARLLRRALVRRHMSQVQLACRLGVTKQAVSRWLHVGIRPSPEHQRAIQTMLGVPVLAWCQLPQDDR